MSFQLVPIDKGSSLAIPLQRPVVLIGRHPECDVRIDLPKISRRHCCLALAYDRVLIRDLGSRNGLRVNGRLVEEARLQIGDEVAIGPIILRLETEDVAPIPTLPPSPNASATAPGLAGSVSQPVSAPPLPDDSEIDLIPLDDV
jgi:pSer/pThr/pTyr-binding forkhead associated (FHA) protein